MTGTATRLPFGGTWFSDGTSHSVEYPPFNMMVFRGANLTTLRLEFGRRKLRVSRFKWRRVRRWSAKWSVA